jgi:dTDP-D-glucose 4,6-dehydratase
MRRVLLTGAGGFCGAHCLEHILVNTDWEIVCIDSFRHRGKTDRIREVLDAHNRTPAGRSDTFHCRDRVKVLTHDLVAPISSQLDYEIGHIDYVISMASESHVDRSCVEPRPFVENNVALVLTLLEWMRERQFSSRQPPPEKFIHVSTDEVYGPAPIGHNHVEGEPHRPSNPYSASKAAQEDIVYSYWRTYGLPIAVSNCWDMETRLLTEDGLRGYDEVEIGTKVWTLNEHERMTLQPIQDKVRMPSPGRMVRIGGPAEQLVTPNHRVMIRRPTGKPRRWGQIEETHAESLLGMPSRLAIPRNGGWLGCDSDRTILQLGPLHDPRWSREVDAAWLARLFGWYVSEGFLSGTTCCFGAGSEKQMVEMESLLKGWGNVYRNGRSVRVANRELADVLRWAGEGSRGKRIPAAVRTLATRHLEMFLDAAIDGDGTRYGSGGVIYTVSEDLASDYAEVAMKCGYAVRISERQTRHPRKDEMIHSYIVRLSRRSDSMIEARHITEENHEGEVWCVSVPSGRVFSERGGTICLTGQTMNIIGERQDPEKFVPLVLSKLLKGETVPLHASMDEYGRTRSWGSRYYLHARNQADALLFLLARVPFPTYGESDFMGRWNVVGERELLNLEMAQLIAEYADVVGFEYEAVDFHSSRPGHDLRYALDGRKMSELGWKPPVPLEESLERTVKWTLSNPRWMLP